MAKQLTQPALVSDRCRRAWDSAQAYPATSRTAHTVAAISKCHARHTVAQASGSVGEMNVIVRFPSILGLRDQASFPTCQSAVCGHAH
ncbi:Uncharacterised protein [Mycobacteroides abscessus subsp. abscessus]|nr:Uncharacterised protein [Mycobacteroides abscessus subsp. abscessus]